MKQQYELGITFPGQPTEEQEVDILQAALDKYGDDPQLWVRPPEIIRMKAAVRGSDFTLRGPLRVEPPRWGYYGILKAEPEDKTVVLVEGTQHMRYDAYSPDLV